MKFSIGDIVKMKHTAEEGVVVQALGKGMLEVRVKEVSFPVFEDEVEHPYLHWFTEKRKHLSKALPEIVVEKKAPQRMATGLYLQFFPEYIQSWEEDLIERFKIYLLNETEMTLQVSYLMKGEQHFEFKTTLRPFQNMLVHSVPFESVVAAPFFSIEAQAETQKFAPYAYKLKTKKAHEYLHTMRMQNNPNFSLGIPLITPEPVQENQMVIVRKPQQQTLQLHQLKSSLAHLHIPSYIDLHTDALGVATKGKSNTDILHEQLHHCRQYIENAIRHHVPSITIVHGIGKGVLRSSVAHLLGTYPQVKKMDNNWDARFGFGATHVYF